MRDARGFTLVELLMVIAIVAILASMVLIAYRQARIRANETSAVSALESISQAQFAFFQTCGGQRYAPSLASLGVAVPGGSAFLSPDLTAGDQVAKAGYVIQMGGTADLDARPACNGAAVASGYQVSADPVVPGSTGTRFFGSNVDRAIYEDLSTFFGNMPETGAPSHGTEISTQ